MSRFTGRCVGVFFCMLIFASLSACSGTYYPTESPKQTIDYTNLGPIILPPSQLADPRLPPPPPRYCGMAQQQFRTLIGSLDGKFDDEKVVIAQAALKTNYVTSAQLRVILQQFSFDDGKLAVAQTACRELCDPQNAFTMYDVMTFKQNVEKLQAACE